MDNNNLKQTRFDSMVSNRDMQLVKAVIPYIDNRFGAFIGTYIKLMELQRASQITPAHITAKSDNIFDDIKDFLEDEQRENIEMLISLLEIMKTDDNSAEDFINNYMGMFNF